MNKNLIILDRDGCINALNSKYGYVYNEKDFLLYLDAIDFCERAIKLGVRLAIATNQQGIDKKLYTLEDVNVLHQKLLQILFVDVSHFPIFVCPHLDNDSLCGCRKPKPGLLLKAMNYFETPPESVLFIGDSISDKVAAENACVDFCHLDRFDRSEFNSDFRMQSLSWAYIEDNFK